MGKMCPYYNCIVISQDCFDCDEKYCRYIKARKTKVCKGDLIKTKLATYKYLGITKEIPKKRILINVETKEELHVAEDFFKLSHFKVEKGRKYAKV